MLVSIKYDFVFLCTPKCASTSIEEVLQPYSDISLAGPNYFRHTNLREYKQYLKPYISKKAGSEDIETVCLIREPVSWLYSWYRFRARYQLRNPNHPSHQNSTAHLTFPDFVKAYMSPAPPPFAANIGSQFDFVRDDRGEIGVEMIFLYENLEGFMGYMQRKVGKPLALPHRNVSPSKNYRSNFVEYLGYQNRKISRLFKLRHHTISPKVESELPDELLNSLQKFMAHDFGLYEMLKTAQIS